MRVGYFAIGMGPLTEPAMIKTVALATERVGFSTLWAPEHVVLLSEYASRYPYSDAGRYSYRRPLHYADLRGGADLEDSPRHRHLPCARAQPAGAGQDGRH